MLSNWKLYQEATFHMTFKCSPQFTCANYKLTDRYLRNSVTGNNQVRLQRCIECTVLCFYSDDQTMEIQRRENQLDDVSTQNLKLIIVCFRFFFFGFFAFQSAKYLRLWSLVTRNLFSYCFTLVHSFKTLKIFEMTRWL